MVSTTRPLQRVEIFSKVQYRCRAISYCQNLGWVHPLQLYSPSVSQSNLSEEESSTNFTVQVLLVPRDLRLEGCNVPLTHPPRSEVWIGLWEKAVF